jgi:5-oxoprolinase (ATP-hydrolysing)
MNNTTWGNDKYQYYETICGGTGAGINFDGASYEGTSGVHSHMTNSRLTDPEVLENRFPVVIEDFSIRENSSGKGQFNGGEGVIRKIRFLEKMTLAILSGHRVKPPPGLSGGGAGALGFSKVIRKNGKIKVLGSADKISMEVGDVFWLETPGGGGLGKSK